MITGEEVGGSYTQVRKGAGMITGKEVGGSYTQVRKWACHTEK